MARKLILIGSILFLLVTIPVALFLVRQNQDPRQRAQQTTPSPSTCAPIQSTTSVLVDFPACNNTQCDLTQASCEWEQVSEASSYNITVTQIEDGTVVMNNESTSSAVTKILFPIVQNRTYKCDVVAVSACGSVSTAVSDQLLCEADALLATPTPTPPPNQPIPTPTPTGTLPATPTQIPPTQTPILSPTPTAPPIYLPTSTPTATPTIKQPGSLLETIGIVGLLTVIVIGGIVLLIL